MAENPLNHASVRAFLAIPLFDIFRKEIDSLLWPICREISGVHWAEPSQVHLTLHFFGSIPALEIESIDSSMKKVASLFAPFGLRMNGIGGFPDLEKPQTVWLGVEEKTGALLSLQKILQDEVKQLGFKVEARPFHPHATIGRVKKKAGDLGPIFAKIPFEFPASERAADHFVFYQSHCLPKGARYEILKTYALSKKAQT